MSMEPEKRKAEKLGKAAAGVLGICFEAVSRGVIWVGKLIVKMFGMNPQIAAGVLAILLAAVLALGAVMSIDISSTNVNLRMANIGELATQSAYTTNVQVIRNVRELFGWEGWNIPFTGNEYIFSYDAEVKAGIDFEEIEARVDHKKKEVHVVMPQTRILTTAIDPGSLQIYDEERSVFTPLTLEEMDRSLTTIEEQAVQTAVENGILENAQEHAKVLIKAFVTGMLSDVDINTYTFTFEIIANGEETANE